MSRILVVEHDEAIVQLLSDLLTEEGYDVAGCTQSARVFAAVGAFAPDLILIRAGMPHLDGFDLVRLLSEDKALRKVPIILVTGGNIQVLRRKEWPCDLLEWTWDDLAGFGVVGFLRAPFELGPLVKDVAYVLGKREDSGGAVTFINTTGAEGP
jgi:CheY-like chemotaxis protein